MPEQKKVVKKKKVLVKKKKPVPKKSKSTKIYQKYGILLVIFFLLSSIYFAWLYGYPALLNSNTSKEKITNFVEKRIGFTIDYADASFYTTNTLDIGIKFRDLKVFYKGAKSARDDAYFLKSRLATFEIPFIPYLMKTIRFKECTFRTTKINLYQDEKGRYVYLNNVKYYFNPQMPKYICEIPTISIHSYNIYNYNKKTETFTKSGGNVMNIKPAQVKTVLRDAPKANTIMLR